MIGSLIPGAGWKCPEPPGPCSICGATPGADHAEDCNNLALAQSFHYPMPVDRNGRPWYENAIAKRDARIAELEAELAKR